MSYLPRLVALTTALLLAPLARGEAPNPDLPRAQVLIDALRYPEASRALDAARARPGNDHDTLLRILELQGVVAAMLNQPAKARTAFQTLLVLSPEHRLEGEYAPRVMTPFFEAKAWVADNSALLWEASPMTDEGPVPDQLLVRVTADPLKLVRTVRFHLRAPGAEWSQQEQPLAQGQATVEAKGAPVQWWAELLDERQAVLARIGSAETPLPLPVPKPKALDLALTKPADNAGLEEASTSPLRPLAYVSLAVAAGSGAAGAYFGLRARSARAEVEGATVNDQGLTTGLTQREAYALDERARSSARVANVLFVVAGAAAVAGGTLWIFGTPVTVQASPAGVAVGGELP